MTGREDVVCSFDDLLEVVRDGEGGKRADELLLGDEGGV